MNGLQKTMIILGIVALLTTLAYCPWATYCSLTTPWAYDPLVYHPIFSPPPVQTIYKNFQAYYHVTIDYGRLGVEWAVIVLTTIGLVFVFMERKSVKDILAHASRTSFATLAGPATDADPNKPAYETDLDAAPPPAFARNDDQVE
jgi:hypothetical protein